MADTIVDRVETDEEGVTLIVGDHTFQVPDPPANAPIDQRDLHCNLSALLYLIVEQQAMISEMLSVLVKHSLITTPDLVKITAAKDDVDLNNSWYQDLYLKYVDYFLKTKWSLLTPEERAQAETLSADDENSPSPERGD